MVFPYRRYGRGGGAGADAGLVAVLYPRRWRRLPHIAHAVCAAIHSLDGPDAQVRGHGDVAIPHEDGWRKVLGAYASAGAIPFRRLDDRSGRPTYGAPPCPPSRQPDYRANRTHGDFCDHLSRHGLSIAPLASACEAYITEAHKDLVERI